jgi:hypothetical protein
MTRSDVLDYLDSPRFARHALTAVALVVALVLVGTSIAGCHSLLYDVPATEATP